MYGVLEVTFRVSVSYFLSETLYCAVCSPPSSCFDQRQVCVSREGVLRRSAVVERPDRMFSDYVSIHGQAQVIQGESTVTDLWKADVLLATSRSDGHTRGRASHTRLRWYMICRLQREQFVESQVT